MTTLTPQTGRAALTGAALLSAEARVDDVRAAMMALTAQGEAEGWQPEETAYRLRGLVGELLTPLAEGFWQAELAAWVDSLQWHAGSIPTWLLQHLAESRSRGQPPRRTSWRPTLGDDDGGQVRFPMIERAAKSLADRSLLTRDEFDVASDQFRARAFTVAGDLSTGAIGQIRDMLRDLTVTGPSRRGFEEQLSERLQTGLLGPGHVETVFRTNIQAAYRDGREALLSDPVVAEAFPYQAYWATHDARTRATHRALEKLGLSGTNIYRRDDPVWDRFTPPWDYNCRCAVTLLTLDAAARAGVAEAREWLASGRQPARPEYRVADIPFEPNPGFGQRVGVAV